MNPKDDFLYRLAVSVEDAERKSGNRPDDKQAATDAAALRDLYGHLAGFSADHVFFRAMRLVPPKLTTPPLGEFGQKVAATGLASI